MKSDGVVGEADEGEIFARELCRTFPQYNLVLYYFDYGTVITRLVELRVLVLLLQMEVSVSPYNLSLDDYVYDIDDDCYFNYTDYDEHSHAQPRSWSCFYWEELIPTLVRQTVYKHSLLV